MCRFFLIMNFMLLFSFGASAVQVIHRYNDDYHSTRNTYELNCIEEQQELLRKQIQIQEDMLRLQQQQYRQNYYHGR